MSWLPTWTDTIVKHDSTIHQAMEVLDKTSMRLVVITRENGVLEGIVTDGDIRRAILQGIKLTDNISSIMNTKPLVVREGANKEYIKNLMIEQKLLVIPIVDQHKVILGIETIDTVSENINFSSDVVLMAGGFGTRLYPLTKDIPKPLLKIGKKSLLASIIDNLVEQGFCNIHISTHYKAEMISEYFGDGEEFGCKIKYIHEEKPLGTAGSLSLMKNNIQSPFIVMNADILTKIKFQKLLDYHKQHQQIATMCVREEIYQVPYGVVELNDLSILSIYEKPIYSNFVNAGIYCFNEDVFKYIQQDNYYNMPELFQDIINDKQKINAYPIHEYWLDIGRMNDYQTALKYSE